jgi:hypothetical protein
LGGGRGGVADKTHPPPLLQFTMSSYSFTTGTFCVSFTEEQLQDVPKLLNLLFSDNKTEFPSSIRDLEVLRDFLYAKHEKEHVRALSFEDFSRLERVVGTYGDANRVTQHVSKHVLEAEGEQITLCAPQLFVSDMFREALENVGHTGEVIPYPGTPLQMRAFQSFVKSGDVKKYVQTLSDDDYQLLYIVLFQVCAEKVRKAVMIDEFSRRIADLTTPEIAKIYASPTEPEKIVP